MENKVDKTVWDRKDKLNARMSAIKAASVIFEGSGADDGNYLAHADAYYSWLTQDQEWLIVKVDPKNEVETMVKQYPVPTKDQIKWLDSIKEKYGFTKEQVFDTSGSYPSTKEMAIKVVQQLKTTGEKNE
jgi:hypothetical protein